MEQLDVEYYSREIFALGKEAMEKLSEFKVLVTGMSVLGSQIARLLVLSGIKTVFLHDEAKVSLDDVKANDLLVTCVPGNSTRAQVLQPLLQAFNHRVAVNIAEGELLSLNVKEYDLVIATDKDITTLTRLSNLCREKSKHLGFIACEVWGATGTVFVDFNNEFLVYDKDGLEPESYLISNIVQSCPGIVTIEDERLLRLTDGDWVTFKGVHGMVEVTLPEPRPIKYINSTSFSIEDTTAYSGYISGGVVTQFKMPDIVTFQSFQQSLLAPLFDDGLSHPDILKGDRVGQLHFAFHAVHEFLKKHGFLPTAEHINECFDISVKLNQDAKEENRFNVEEINRELISNVAAWARLKFKPVLNVISGVAALEVIKFTGKFMPIRQWFHYDCLDALNGGQGMNVLEESQKVKDLKAVVVGAGAIGCELLSLMSGLGVGCGNGSLTILDEGIVNYPNLCTHSLFREEDISRKKAELAAEILKRRNPNLHVTGLPLAIGSPALTDEFWENKDLILFAADNEEGMKTTENQAIWYEKPAIFSFMSGATGNVACLLPLKTGQLEIPSEEEKKIDPESLSFFPCRSSMCVEWAILQFTRLFTNLPSHALLYLENPQKFIMEVCNDSLPSARLATFQLLREFFELLISTDPTACVAFARRQFDKYFSADITKLLEDHPLDQETEDGRMFWTGRKLPPEAIVFNAHEELHFNFVATCADLLSKAVGRTLGLNKLEVKKIASQKAHSRELEVTSQASKFDVIQESIDALCVHVDKTMIHPIKYEKDDQVGTQLEFIVSAAHLRAENYKIDLMERLKIKQMAGGLKPSLPAMSSLVAGLAAAEVLKHVNGLEVDQLREVQLNLAVPQLTYSEPRPLQPVKPHPSLFEESALLLPAKFTLWDKVLIRGPLTLQQFITKLEQDFAIHVLIIYTGAVVLYNVVNGEHEDQTSLKSLYEQKAQLTLQPGSTYLKLQVEARTQVDDRNAILPVIKYAL